MTTPTTARLLAADQDELDLAAGTELHRAFGDETNLYIIADLTSEAELPTRRMQSGKSECGLLNDGIPTRVLELPNGARSPGTHLLATPVAVPLDHCTLHAPPAADFEAVIFDVDGTLVDSLKAYFSLAEHAASHHGLPVEWPMIKNALNQNTLNFWELIVPSDHDDRDGVIKDMQQRARDAWPQVLAERVTLMPSTTALVVSLADRQLRMGIVTSSGGDAMQPLKDADLMDHFASVITRHDVNCRKPDPEGILKVLDKVGVAPGKAAYVGDSIMDVRAAHNAGVVAIGVLCGSGDNATLTAERPHYLFADAADLVELLA